MISRTLLSLVLAAFLLAVAAPNRAAAQSTDAAFTGADQILRYMRGQNYSEDDLIRRLVWTDKIVNDLVAFRPSDDDRPNYLKLLNMAITHYQDENVRLRVLLRAVTTLDPLVSRYFPQWLVQDEAMILEIMRKIRDNRDDLRDNDAIEVADRVLTGKAKMRIMQSPNDQENLIAIIIEKARTKNPNNPESAGFSTSLDNNDYEDYRIVGRKNLKMVLTDDLYADIAAKDKYSHIMETGVMKPAPYVAEANVGIPFGGGFLWTLESDERPQTLGPAIMVSRVRAGFELKIGNEWVNLPFLYGPEWNALVVYEPTRTEYIKIGPSVPFSWGDISINTDFPVLKPRKLNGTWGMSGEYFKQLSNVSGSPGTDADGIGAAAFVSFGINSLGTKKITNTEGEIINGDNTKLPYKSKEWLPAASDPNNMDVQGDWNNPADRPGIAMYLKKVTFYYLTSSATTYYWRDLGFLLDGLRIAGGVGYQKVNEARRSYYKVDSQNKFGIYDSVRIVSGEGILDPYLRLSYDHHGKTTYGTALQYFNGGLMGEAYIHIFSWMRAEVKYSRVVFRDPKLYELKEMIVPGIRIGFAF
jgi:hypothetical protein